MGMLQRVRLRLAALLLSGLYDVLPYCVITKGTAITIEKDFTREELFAQRLQPYFDEASGRDKDQIRREALRLDVVLN